MRPIQNVRFWKIQRRPKKRRPWTVRWVVDGHEHSRSFEKSVLATRYRSRLVVARDDGERFDPRPASEGGTGEPLSWSPAGANTAVYDWARTWLANDWDEIAPRTRKSYTEALSRFVPLVMSKDAPAPPEGVWQYLAKALRPDADIDPDNPHERWLRRWGLALGDLDKALLEEVDRKLGLGAKGQPLAALTAKRYRTSAKACVRRAVELDQIPADPWPARAKGRGRRKANRVAKAVDIRRLPNPETMAEILDALPERRSPRRARLWKVLSATVYYAGPRPSEAIMLRRSTVHLPYLPAGGWCVLEVDDADDGEGNAADPKTGYRPVPGPPVLTEWLWSWIIELGLTDDDLLFETERGELPRLNLWGRALKRACEHVGAATLAPYDLRHACATTWIKAGVALGEAARRLGHSVQTLVGHYIQALTGDEQTANARIEDALALPRECPVNNRELPSETGNNRERTATE